MAGMEQSTADIDSISGLVPPSEKEMRERAERVVDRFIEAFHK